MPMEEKMPSSPFLNELVFSETAPGVDCGCGAEFWWGFSLPLSLTHEANSWTATANVGKSGPAVHWERVLHQKIHLHSPTPIPIPTQKSQPLPALLSWSWSIAEMSWQLENSPSHS